MFFPIDLVCKDGLRSVCRECSTQHGKFLDKDYVVSKKWTDKEKEKLKEVYNQYTGKELVEKFFPDRTVRAIESQASLMNLGKKDMDAYRRGRESQAKSITGISRPMSDETKNKLSQSLKLFYMTHDSPRKGVRLTKKQIELMRKRSKENSRWKGKNNPRVEHPLKGEENGRWQGGITKLYQSLRENITIWKKESMCFCNYKCVITGGKFDNIHHTTPFKKIVNCSFDILNLDVREKVEDYSKNDFDLLKKEINNLHEKYGLGACLNKDVHKLFHDNYGYSDFTLNDFLNFYENIINGMYDEWFLENKLQKNINMSYFNYLSKLNKII